MVEKRVPFWKMASLVVILTEKPVRNGKSVGVSSIVGNQLPSHLLLSEVIADVTWIPFQELCVFDQ